MGEAELIPIFGPLLARRLVHELMPSELQQVFAEDMPEYLEIRAVAAERLYRETPTDAPEEQKQNLLILWRQAEELAYLAAIATDAVSNSRQTAVI